MKLFHEEYGTYNDTARALDLETTAAIRPLFEKYLNIGCSIREIAYVIASNVGMEECERRLTRNSKIAKARSDKRKAGRNDKNTGSNG